MNLALLKAQLTQSCENFLHDAKESAQVVMAGNDPKALREIAEHLHDLEHHLKYKLQSLQGKINSQAFGR